MDVREHLDGPVLRYLGISRRDSAEQAGWLSPPRRVVYTLYEPGKEPIYEWKPPQPASVPFVVIPWEEP